MRDLRTFARALWKLADLVQAAERQRSFRARAFHAAVWALDDIDAGLEASGEEMEKVEGIGPGIIRLIDEFQNTGRIDELEKLAARFPADSARLRRLPRMKPIRLQALKALGVDTTADLLAAIDSGATETVPGVGPATADRWRVILGLAPSPGATPAHQAAVTAGRLRRHLNRHLGDAVEVAGAVRRLDEWVDRIDLVVTTTEPARLAEFLEQSAVFASSAVEPGWAVDLITHDEIPVAVRMTEPDSAGTALIRWTGPKEHVEALGLDALPSRPREQDVYRAAGLDWVPPPARSHPTPTEVVTVDQLVGDLHIHSTWSPDGHMSIESIVEAAAHRGYRYIALTDHTIGLRFGGLDEAGLRQQAKEMAEVRRRFPDVRLLHGAEVNFDRNGDPDLSEDALAGLDFVVAGCHSDFDLPRAEQTRRLIRVIQHPSVNVVAHPTGRRIGLRPAMNLDLEAVFEAAAEENIALEVNGHRDRMDLSADLVSLASHVGVLFAANSDAHRLPELDNVSVSVGILQRAGLPSGNVVNTWDTDAFSTWLDGRRLPSQPKGG